MLKIIISFVAVLIPAVVFAASLDKIQFIKISAQESKAVIKAAAGKMQVVKPGDTIADNTTIKEIAPGRIVLEEKTERGMETIIVRMDNGKTRVEHLRKLEQVPHIDRALKHG
ncbi:MAG: hypothetical protein A2X79_08000 [Desulfuromonadaceae bacterium GWB2_53_15]|nr:MAG: hypothetical protein A2X83_05495 [Desulfuromonadales bacterium GWD2_54_10]OHB33095.1 MAG: hypothetical protein A2X79_08000 [Desulfuromonadaceae bacterium GWB2_53_15]